MKPKSNPFIRSAPYKLFTGLAAVFLLAGQSAQAVNYWFDLNATTAGFGVTNGNTYDWTAGTPWTTDNTGAFAVAGIAWPGGSNLAGFIGAGGSTSYSVTLGATDTSTVTLQNLILNSNAANVTAIGSGDVVIGGVGSTGTLSLNAANSIGTAAGTLTINSKYDLGSSRNTNFRGGTVIINGVVSGTGTSGVALAAGAFGLTGGTLTLAGNNSFAGNTSVASGYNLDLKHANALGATGGTNTVSSGGALKVTGVTIGSGESVTISGSGVDFFGALSTGTGNVAAEWQGAVTIGATTGTRVGTIAGNLKISGNIGQSAAGSELIIRNSLATSTVFLAGSNSYTGSTLIASGIASVATIGNGGVDSPLGQNGTIRLGLTNVSGGNLTYTGNGETTTKVIDLSSTVGAVTLDHSGTNLLKFSSNFTATGSGAKTLTLQGSTAGIGEIAGAIVNSASATSITKAGSGTWVMSGPNTYSGTTTLTAGTLQIGVGNVGSVGAITSSAVGTGGLTFNGGTLSSDGTTARTILNAVTFTGNATLGNATNNGKLTFSAGMNLGAVARTMTLNSDVQLDGAFSNPGTGAAVTKAGTGTLTINVSNAGVNFGNGNPSGFQITAGKVIATNTAAFGNAGQIVTLNGGTGTSAGSSVEFATDSSPNAYVLNQNSGNNGTVILNRASSGTAITYSMGTATLGQNSILNVVKGGNVTDTPILALSGLSLTAGASGTTTLNPTSANISISGAVSSISNFAKTLKLDGTSVGNTIGGDITNGTNIVSLTKSNASTWTLSGTNTYSGNTTVTGGTLAISGAGSIANTPLIQINSSTNLDVTGITGTTFTLGAAQTLAGGGTVLATGKTMNVSGTLSPGASPGTLTQNSGLMQLGIGGDYNWQIHDATGAAGTGYDTTALTNSATLDLSLLSAGNTFNINLWSLSGVGPDVNGDATNFNNALTQSWILFSTGSDLSSGFSVDKFTINSGAFNGTTGFTNALGGGAFSIGLADSNTDIVLTFTAVPEPNAAALLGTLGTLILLRRRRVA